MVKVSSLLKAAVLVCTLVMLRYPLMLPGNAPLETKVMQAAVVALAGVILALFTLLVMHRRFNRHFKWLFQYLIPYLLVIAFSVLYSAYLYNYSVLDMIRSASQFLYIFFAIPLIYIFCCDGSCLPFLRTAAALQAVMLGIKTVAWFTYNFTSTPLFKNLVFEFDNWAREGLQRLEQGQLYGLALVMYAYLAVRKRFSVKYAAITVGIVSYVIFVTQARNGMVAAVATVGVIIYFARRKGVGKLWLRALLAAGIIVILLSGVIPRLIESASLSGTYGGSTRVRILNWNYYMGLITRKQRIFGMGLLDLRNKTTFQIITHGGGLRYYLEDLGILGGVVRFGILSVVVYIWLFVLIGKTCWKCYKNKDYRYFPFLIGIAACMASNGLVQNMFDQSKAYGTTFFLAAISYIDAETSRIPQQSGMGEDRESV